MPEESQVLQSRLVDIVVAAEFLSRGVNTLYIDCRADRVPHYRIGNSIRFDLDELRVWLETQRRGPKVDAL